MSPEKTDLYVLMGESHRIMYIYLKYILTVISQSIIAIIAVLWVQ